MARKCYVGFWPWPRVWTTEEAYELARSLEKDDSSIHLAEPVTEEQAKVFREVSYEYLANDFELQICADGLFLYRDNALEEAIINAAEIDNENSDPWVGFDDIMNASGAAYRHYIPALNILFALVESELHSHGRNSTIYWAQPIGRTDMIRVKNAQSTSENSSLTSFGAVTEMQLQCFSGNISLGARIDGLYHQEIPAAFKDACEIFENAYYNQELWSFLEKYSNAWANFQTELYESALALSWSIIERDLVKQVTSLTNIIPAGNLQKLDLISGSIVNLSRREETQIRNKLQQGESPMAGKIISILTAHQVPLHALLEQVKDARNAHQHRGAIVDPERCRDALTVCAEICQREFNIELNCRLQKNAHLGITC